MSTAGLTPEQLHEDHSYLTTIAIGFGIALPIVAVGLRLCARKINNLKLGPDDYMIIVAAVLTVVNSCIPILANQGGNGRHEETLNADEKKKYFLALFIFEQTFGVAVCATKISVLLLYRRIFITRSFRISTTILGTLIILWVIVKNLVGALQCRPVRKAWIKSTPGQCLNFIDLVLGAQAFNVAFDICILILPINAVYKLHLSLRKRIGVMAIFAVGAFTIIIAIIRLGVISSEVLVYGPTLPDVTWFTSKFSWTVIDPAVGCFVACMPTYSPLIKPLRHIRDYASLKGSSWTRSTNITRKGTTKIEDNSAENFYLANYKQTGTREVTVARKSSSINSRQELHPVPGTVTVKREFTQADNREGSL